MREPGGDRVSSEIGIRCEIATSNGWLGMMPSKASAVFCGVLVNSGQKKGPHLELCEVLDSGARRERPTTAGLLGGRNTYDAANTDRFKELADCGTAESIRMCP